MLKALSQLYSNLRYFAPIYAPTLKFSWYLKLGFYMHSDMPQSWQDYTTSHLLLTPGSIRIHAVINLCVIQYTFTLLTLASSEKVVAASSFFLEYEKVGYIDCPPQ